MEEGVVGELLRGPIGACAARCSLLKSRALTCKRAAGDCFDPAQLISGVSGSGNNWACGAHHYGAQALRSAVLSCPALNPLTSFACAALVARQGPSTTTR